MLLVDTSKSCNSGCLFGGATCRRQYEQEKIKLKLHVIGNLNSCMVISYS